MQGRPLRPPVICVNCRTQWVDAHIGMSIKIGDKVRRGGAFVLGKAFQIV